MGRVDAPTRESDLGYLRQVGWDLISMPSGRVWIEGVASWYDRDDADLLDPKLESDVDCLTCSVCDRLIGWWVDVDDDTGRTIGGFVPYGLSRDRRRRWCEDCVPGGRP